MFQIRPCEMYKDEYKDCTNFKSRFHQYFIYGETLDCVQWKKDLDNCERWVENQNIKSRVYLISVFSNMLHKNKESHALSTPYC
jgi:hypothetical protein